MRSMILAIGLSGIFLTQAAESPVRKTESFDRDPGWDGHNNRATFIPARNVRQNFGYSRTNHAGGAIGEIGGFISPAAEPAYYAKRIAPMTFNDAFSASGSVVIGAGGNLDDGAGNTLLGFFNAETSNEWRTPNTLAFRLNGRGDVFHAHVEYATSKWRAGAYFYDTAPDPATGKRGLRGIRSGPIVHTWSLKYDPAANQGQGAITAMLDGEALVVPLDPSHKADGATFNRFGFLNVMKSADTGATVYVDDLVINGVAEKFDRDPQWDQHRNRLTYVTENIRPRFDFGYTATRHAGGKAAGEIGGLSFRGDDRYPERMAYYGDRLDSMTLEKPLRASGRIALRRGVTDSTSLVGFFHAQDSMRVSPKNVSGIPENFLGISIEGPSREGFLVYPIYGIDQDGTGGHGVNNPGVRHIYPDGASHEWTLEYTPSVEGGGTISVTFDGHRTAMRLSAEHRRLGARFNRFGIVTTHIDGNGQQLYLDDLAYTRTQ